MHLSELVTPALVVDQAALDGNLATMAAALPGARLRPHVKAHKCTSLAARQAATGHHGFTCATIRECEGLAAAGLGEDLLLANEVLDTRRIGALLEAGHRVTVCVDSAATIAAAVAGGVREVVVDVNVGLPRCGCAPEDAAGLAELARSLGLSVRGVQGYEGHVVGLESAVERTEKCKASMEILAAAHAAVGGELMSAGGTGTYVINTWASEIQAGSYVLMDTAYGRLGLPFRQAVYVLATVISTSAPALGAWSVADAGLKAFGMDHGLPEIAGSKVWYCSDEHIVFEPARHVGDRVLVAPAHVDPTIAYHERMHLADLASGEILETWPVDLRGW
ncbi:MAG TPA: alanine racemase [Acidimicrobiales bacterium]|nr:alanine racemase [Acidimicrobiales bacterium]